MYSVPYVGIASIKSLINRAKWNPLFHISIKQVAERHDAILRLKTDYKELEEKHREALATISHRGGIIQQFRDDTKTKDTQVCNGMDGLMSL